MPPTAQPSHDVAAPPLVARGSAPCRLLAALGAVMALAACGGEARSPQRSPLPPDAPTSDGPEAATPRATVVAHAVLLGTYDDSARASAVSRQLADSGWTPRVRDAPVGGRHYWRVYVAATPGDSTTPELMASGVRVTGGEALAVRDTFAVAELAGLATARAVRVTQGVPGTLARVRWALSPDATAMVVVEDAAGVGNAPVPDGFVFASEGLNCYVQGDSVWDVAPDPAWRQLGVGRAHHPGGATRDPTAADWLALAGRLGLDADSARRGSFVTGRTTPAPALAHPAVVTLVDDAPGSARDGPPVLRRRALPMVGGWRVGWTPDGRTLALGTNPGRAQDDESPDGWISVRDGEAPVLDAVSVGQLAQPAWVQGPTLDPTLPVELTRSGAGADGATITNVGGWIRAADGAGRFRIVGPGVALAATRGGRFVLALAPHPDARRDAPVGRLVVYAAAVWGVGVPEACGTADVRE